MSKKRTKYVNRLLSYDLFFEDDFIHDNDEGDEFHDLEDELFLQNFDQI
ncbi:MAG: hypothetical protein ACOYJC_03945 [Christensenellales bacterium]|jgi:hypothetical protein